VYPYYPQNHTANYNRPVIYNTLQNPQQGNTTNSNQPVKTSILYFNDYHGCSSKMGELKTASDYFTRTTQNSKVDSFKLAAGDILKGKNPKINSMWVDFLNMMKLDFSAIGNHELDQSPQGFNNCANRANYSYVSSNMEINPYGTLAPAVRNNKIVSSWVENRNGHLYGFVGLTPSDDKYRKPGKKLNNNDIRSIDAQSSLERVQKEVDKLRQRGINKIILLSHFDDMDNKISKNITGVDIIVSGHKHRVYKGLVPGENLFSSPAGDPMIKVEGGRDGEYVGTLDVTFDSNGVITNAKNNLQKTSSIPEDISVIPLKQKYQVNDKPIGILRNPAEADGFRENTVASFVADAVRKKSGADIVLIPGGSIYEGLDKGILTTGDIERVIPFDSELYKVKVSEKDIIEALKRGTKPSPDDDSETHLLQSSGLKYTITADKDIKDVYFVTPDKKQIPLNWKNPGTDKKFTAVYGKYLLKGKNNFTCLEKSPEQVQNLGWNKKDATIEFIRSKEFVPFKIIPDNRIKVE